MNSPLSAPLPDRHDSSESGSEPARAAAEAARVISAATGKPRHTVAVVLGSGWQDAADAFGEPDATVPMAGLPGFAPPTARGHAGTIRSVHVGDHDVLLLLGRTHAYEGHALARVVHPVRSATAAGAQTVILTNAAGGIAPDLVVGQPVLVSDHLNLTARSPLTGAEFVDLVDAYSPMLRAHAQRIDPTLTEGVYAGLPGPHYETPAEIRMLRTLGADLVGMSTVHETIAARALGADVLAVSLVTNLAAGITGEHLDHREVLAAGRASATRMGTLLRDVVAAL
ncbi:purine-nucleoside phosphorylase [Rhodococcus sp. HNM0569]|uniref:purine-nucleoside phosphorylase n=1 Tax=Rhodococcus sp. HNM0569 TaxID=2716340 RepID=UPI00146F759E|nr:purine-nucleoside phosphorylase [Rhodococcus sp. HNM0569]NLU81844.1 purine-nucleoside phosphorylase [Rhodococcus sp. HNM0569]